MNHAFKRTANILSLLAMLTITWTLSIPAIAATSAIVDTAYVVDAQKRNAIIWDTRSAALYKQGHIPGAINIGDIGHELRDAHREFSRVMGFRAAVIDRDQSSTRFAVSPQSPESQAWSAKSVAPPGASQPKKMAPTSRVSPRSSTRRVSLVCCAAHRRCGCA